MFDKNQMQQVFLNLFLNSLQAMPSGGLLTVNTQMVADPGNNKEHAAITIQDTGCGIPQENPPHIFDPFFTTNNDSGTGLGLAIVYGIIQEHDGNILVASKPQNGTSVVIRLHPAQARSR